MEGEEVKSTFAHKSAEFTSYFSPSTAEDARKLSSQEQAVRRVQLSKDDPYAILSLPRNATNKEIEVAYKRLALLLHPDKAKENGIPLEHLQEAFQKLAIAKETLLDSVKRAEWDKKASEDIDNENEVYNSEAVRILGGLRRSEVLRNLLHQFTLSPPISPSTRAPQFYFRDSFLKIIQQIDISLMKTSKHLPKDGIINAKHSPASPQNPRESALRKFDEYINNICNTYKQKWITDFLHPSEFPAVLPIEDEIIAKTPPNINQQIINNLKLLQDCPIKIESEEASEDWLIFVRKIFSLDQFSFSISFHSIPKLKTFGSKEEMINFASGRNLPKSPQGSNPLVKSKSNNQPKLTVEYFSSIFPSQSEVPISDLPVWVPDQDRKLCKTCNTNFFWIFVKRHHCRRCGEIFCNECSSEWRNLPEFGICDCAVRLCKGCDKESWNYRGKLLANYGIEKDSLIAIQTARQLFAVTSNEWKKLLIEKREILLKRSFQIRLKVFMYSKPEEIDWVNFINDQITLEDKSTALKRACLKFGVNSEKSAQICMSIAFAEEDERTSVLLIHAADLNQQAKWWATQITRAISNRRYTTADGLFSIAHQKNIKLSNANFPNNDQLSIYAQFSLLLWEVRNHVKKLNDFPFQYFISKVKVIGSKYWQNFLMPIIERFANVNSSDYPFWSKMINLAIEVKQFDFAYWLMVRIGEDRPQVWVNLSSKALENNNITIANAAIYSAIKMPLGTVDWKNIGGEMSAKGDFLPLIICLAIQFSFKWELVAEELENGGAITTGQWIREIFIPGFIPEQFWTDLAQKALNPSSEIVYRTAALHCSLRSNNDKNLFNNIIIKNKQADPNLVLKIAELLLQLKYYQWAMDLFLFIYSSPSKFTKQISNLTKTKILRFIISAIDSLNKKDESFEYLKYCMNIKIQSILQSLESENKTTIEISKIADISIKQFELNEQIKWENIVDNASAPLMAAYKIGPKLFAAALEGAYFKDNSIELTCFVQANRLRIGSHFHQMPSYDKASTLMAEGILDVMKGDPCEGAGRIFEALYLAPSLDEYQQLAAKILADPFTRIGALHALKDLFKNISSIGDFANHPAVLCLIDPIRTTKDTKIFQYADALMTTPTLKALRMGEVEIERTVKKGKILEAALTYFDLTQLAPGGLSVASSSLHAARFFLSCVSSAKSNNEKLALCYIAEICLEFANDLAKRLPIISRSSLKFTCAAILSHVIITKEKIQGVYICKRDIDILSSYLEDSFRLANFTPFIRVANRRSADEVLVGLIQREVSVLILKSVETQLGDLIERKLWAYTRFEGIWNGWFPRDDDGDQDDEENNEINFQKEEEKERKSIEKARFETMEELLHSSGHSWQQVSSLINWMKYPRNSQGFLDASRPLYPVNNDYQFTSFDGFQIDINTGKIEFFLSKSKSTSPPIFGWNDIYSILRGGIEYAVFTLDEVDPIMPYHPFHQMKFAPNELQDTSLLASCFHADYLLKFLTTGGEISAFPPFPQRSIEYEGGLLSKLPEYIQSQIIEGSNEMRKSGETAHRFWIDCGDTPYQSYDTKNIIKYVFGDLMMKVKKHLLIRDAAGNLIDAENDSSDHSPEGKFANLLTDLYPLLSRYFPELARLRELTKVMISVRILRGVRDSMRQRINQRDEMINDISSQLAGEYNSNTAKFPKNVTFPLQNDYSLRDVLVNEILTQIPYNQRSANTSQAQKIVCEQLQKINQSIVDQAKSLANQSSFIDPPSLYLPVYKWKMHNDSYTLSSLIVDAQLRPYQTTLNSLNALSIPSSSSKGGLQDNPTSKNQCNLVPAAFVASQYHRIVGGVSLSSNLRSQVVNLPPNASPTMINAAHNYQRANSVPNSPAQMMDNLHNFNRQQFLNQQNSFRNNYIRNGFFGSNIAVDSKNFSTIQKTVLTEPRVVYRAYDNIKASPSGGYWTDTRRATSWQERSSSAILPEWNKMTYMVRSVIPAGTVVYEGKAAPQANFSGGGNQIYIPNVNVRNQMAQNSSQVKTPFNTTWWNQTFFSQKP